MPHPRGRAGQGALDHRIVKAISHPLRHRLLIRLNEAVASPKELARELEEPLGRVSHHIRTLKDIGAIELVRTEQRRGAVEHYYRAVVGSYFGEEDWARLPPSTRRQLAHDDLDHIFASVRAAAGAAGFDDPRAYVAFLYLVLDEQGMDEMSALAGEMLERAARIGDASAARAGPSRSTELVLLHFERTR